MNTKNYIITAANSPLGQAMVKRFSQNSENRLLITTRGDFHFSKIESAQIKHLNKIDLLDASDLKKLCTEAQNYFSDGFNVINCSGYYKGQEPFNNTSVEEASKILDGNFTTVYRVAHYLLPIMIEKGGGHFIAFSCNSVKYNYPQMVPFTAAKAALESFVKSIANEYYQYGICSNAFQLATLLTDYEKKIKPYGDHAHWLQPDQVAEYVHNFISQSITITNGNIINLYHHSDSFYNKSYFDRIKK